MVSARREALARGTADIGHDPYRHSGDTGWQERRMAGACQRRSVSPLKRRTSNGLKTLQLISIDHRPGAVSELLSKSMHVPMEGAFERIDAQHLRLRPVAQEHPEAVPIEAP